MKSERLLFEVGSILKTNVRPMPSSKDTTQEVEMNQN